MLDEAGRWVVDALPAYRPARFLDRIELTRFPMIGSSFVRVAVVTALRTCGGAFLISVIGLSPAKALMPAPAPSVAVVGRVVLPGFLGYCDAVSAQLYALRSLEVGVVAVLGSTAPVLMLPIIWLTTGERPPATAWIGAAAAVAGTAFLFLG